MLETVKENLCVNKIIGNKTYEIVIEGDSIIPDSKPDILSDICKTGNICIYKKEILEGKIRLDGNVNIYLMYLSDGEDGATRGFNANLDFTEILDFPDANSKMTLDEKITIQSIECKVINGRKVGFKVSLKIEAKVFLNENEEMISEIHGIDDAQTQVVSLKMNSLIGQNTTKAMAKETIVIDGTDNLVEVVSSNLSIINKDTKISYNKVLAKADVLVKMVYLTDDRKNQICRRVYTSNGIYRFGWSF